MKPSDELEGYQCVSASLNQVSDAVLDGDFEEANELLSTVRKRINQLEEVVDQ